MGMIMIVILKNYRIHFFKSIFENFQTEGKKNNIRALLCSMHTVLWSDAKCQKFEMHQLVSASDVKKAYRKACLAVHPDKVELNVLAFFKTKLISK